MRQTKQDPAEVFRAFPSLLGDEIREELEGIDGFSFTDYGFYKPRGRVREYWFTCCQQALECRTSADPYENDEIMRAKHGEGTFCPLCGRQIVNMALGRLRPGRESGTYKTLHEWSNVVRLDVHKGGVLMEAGILDCTWSPGEPQFDGWDGEGPLTGECIPEPELEWRPFRRYFATPGQVLSWRTGWADRTHPTREWRQLKTVNGFPFQRYGLGWRDPEDGQYLAYRLGSVIQSELRYCGFEEFFSLHDAETCYGYSLVAYLLAAAKHPQVEFLVKLGFPEVVERMLRGDRCGWNWRAKNPADFFGLSKGEFRLFHRSGMVASELQRFRELEGVDFAAFCREGERLRKSGASLELVDKLAKRVGVSLHKAVSYVLRPGNSAVVWRDYLDAAERLGYDLTRQDVAMPKNLGERHDQAVNTVKYEADRERSEVYRKELLPQLRRRYAFAWDDLEIIVPENAEEIVAEGRILQHCVGGYAARHMAGKLAILFLRRQEDLKTPYITIEMNGNTLKQAHGYRNEWDGATAPLERHKEFFELWLDWVQAGSRRLSNGAPELPGKQKEVKTA